MSSSWRGWCLHLGLASSLALSGAIASSEDCALAQIIPDTTLGNQNSTVTPISPTIDEINGGATRGANLFHSFREFNVDDGRSALFTNPVGIQNILTRVTGTNLSNILGTLGVTGGNANLFLINPNGIIFGENARLSVNGSFVATTANAIGLANGDIFSTNPVEPLPRRLLNVNPSAFFFNQMAAKPITSQALLEVPTAGSLLLVGGEVILNRGALSAPGGHVELGGLVGSGTIGLNVNSNDLRLSFPDGLARANVSLTNSAEVNVRAGGGGSIVINAENFNMAGGSRLRAGIRSGSSSVDSKAGNIEIKVIGAITLTDGSFIANVIQPEAIGKSGDINIQAASVSFTNGSNLIASTFGQGDAGNVNINVRDTVSFDGQDRGPDFPSSGVYNRVEKEARGNGGDINITTGSLYVTNGAVLTTSIDGHGKAGSVNINARDTVSFAGEGSLNRQASGAFSAVKENSVGQGGSINITTGSLFVTNGALLTSSTFGRGNAGSVNINARDTVFFGGQSSRAAFSQLPSDEFSSGAFSRVEAGGAGNAGSINIATGSLFVTNGAVLTTSTLEPGNAGSVNINARDTVSFTGEGFNFFQSGAFSRVIYGSAGSEGSINITAGSLSVTNGAVLTTSTDGQGNAGTININVRDTASFDGVGADFSSSGAYSSVKSNGVGQGGSINITAGSLSVTNGAVLITSTFGQGNGGNIQVTANSVNLSGVGSDEESSGLFTTTERGAIGKGGTINIQTGQLNVRDGAEVNVSSNGSGNAGNLKVETNSIFLDNQAKLRASTTSGEGGNIDLQVQDLILMRHNSSISAEARNDANGGNVTIKTPFIVAVPSEDSDIIAKAVEGRGGNINITTSGMFGLEERPQLTLYSDINASSDFGVNGTIQINTPDIDPNRGLANLPTEVVDASNQIAQTCPAAGKAAQNEFFITGRGGLPPDPRDVLSSDDVFVNLVTLNPGGENRSNPIVSTNQTSVTPAPLVEAQGWVINDQGQMELTAHAHSVTPHSSRQRSSDCNAPKS